MIAPFSELWDRSQGSSARLSTPSTASDLQPCRDAQGSMVRGYRWPVARLRFDIHVMARFLTRNSAGSTVLTWVWITKLLKFSPFPVSCAWMTVEMQGTAGLWRFKPPMRPPTGWSNRPNNFRPTHERRTASSLGRDTARGARVGPRGPTLQLSHDQHTGHPRSPDARSRSL